MKLADRIDWKEYREDAWSLLSQADGKIYIYGAGNLADNLLMRCEEHGISIAGLLTDLGEEQRHGKYEVLCLEEILHSDIEPFNLLIGFAKGYQRNVHERLMMHKKVRRIYEVANPFPGHKRFDLKFVRDNYEALEEIYNKLADEESQRTLAAFINARVHEDAAFVREVYDINNSEFANDFLQLSDKEVYLDIGAYKGASILRFLKATNGNCKKIIGIEADGEFCEAIRHNCEKYQPKVIHSGCWNCKDTLRFRRDDKCSRLDADEGDMVLEVDTVDHLLGDEDVTYYYMGISTCEKEILEGSTELIRRCHPKLQIFYGPSREELYSIPRLIHAINPSYRIYLRFIDAMPSRLYLYAI